MNFNVPPSLCHCQPPPPSVKCRCVCAHACVLTLACMIDSLDGSAWNSAKLWAGPWGNGPWEGRWTRPSRRHTRGWTEGSSPVG